MNSMSSSLRADRRLLGLMPPGQAMLPIGERLLQDAQNLRRVATEFADQTQGLLTVAATHTEARYALPTVVRDLRLSYLGVTLHLQQRSPTQIAQQALLGQADIGIATETLAEMPEILTLPCYDWTRMVVPTGHALAVEAAAEQALTLVRVARYPLVTHEPGYAGRHKIVAGFAREGLKPEIALTGMDADVIKTCAELEIGVGIIPSVVYGEQFDSVLAARDARFLFAVNTTRPAVSALFVNLTAHLLQRDPRGAAPGGGAEAPPRTSA
jgi:LysR family cys regulon transcriptional activator